jgi:hypothetical protein
MGIISTLASGLLIIHVYIASQMFGSLQNILGIIYA